MDTNARVFDYAGILNSQEKAGIEGRISDVEKTTGIRVLVLTNYYVGEQSYEAYCNTFF